MMDLEKVIKGLECCVIHVNCATDGGCPYRSEVDANCLDTAIKDAIALLKAQEAMVMAGAELTDAELVEEIRKAPIVLKPNVDAVPVVRCRDCKHRDPEDKKCDYGGMAVQGLFFPRPDDWFCADGERRDES